MSKKFEMILGENELAILIKELPQDGIIILQGDLASGKTTLVKGIVKFHGIDEHVTSPTFSVMQNYGKIYHYDIYNSGFEGIIKNGLFENLFQDGLHLIEWGCDELLNLFEKYGLSYTIIQISQAKDKRKYEVFCA